MRMFRRLKLWKRVTLLLLLLVLVAGWVALSQRKEEEDEIDFGGDELSYDVGTSDYDVYEISSEDLVAKLKDVRPADCPRVYAQNLPKASIVIVAYNKPQSAVIRTVRSIETHTPMRLLKEIVIVVREADHAELGSALRVVFRSTPLRLVKLDPLNGLPSKLLMVNEVEGPAIVFLEDNLLCNKGWLQPMLLALKEDKTTLVVPQQDPLHHESREFEQSLEIVKTIFTWSLKPMPYEMSYTERIQLQSEAQLVPMSAMTGQTFAINKKFAAALLKIQTNHFVNAVDFSLAVWTCGGRIVTTMCSRVTVMEPHQEPDDPMAGYVAAKWLGKYRQLYTAASKKPLPKIDSKEEMKKVLSTAKLKCQNIGWYVHNVVKNIFGAPPRSLKAFGQLRTRGSKHCFQFNPEHLLVASKSCNLLNKFQELRLVKSGQLVHGKLCATYAEDLYVRFKDCSDQDAHQKWELNTIGQLYNNEWCMTHVTDPYPDRNERQVVMVQKCKHATNPSLGFQIWDFSMVFAK